MIETSSIGLLDGKRPFVTSAALSGEMASSSSYNALRSAWVFEPIDIPNSRSFMSYVSSNADKDFFASSVFSGFSNATTKRVSSVSSATPRRLAASLRVESSTISSFSRASRIFRTTCHGTADESVLRGPRTDARPALRPGFLRVVASSFASDSTTGASATSASLASTSGCVEVSEASTS